MIKTQQKHLIKHNRLDAQLHDKLVRIKQDIKRIHETKVTTLNDTLTYISLVLSFVNSIALITIACLFSNWYKTNNYKQKTAYKETGANQDDAIELESMNEQTTSAKLTNCRNCDLPINPRI